MSSIRSLLGLVTSLRLAQDHFWGPESIALPEKTQTGDKGKQVMKWHSCPAIYFVFKGILSQGSIPVNAKKERRSSPELTWHPPSCPSWAWPSSSSSGSLSSSRAQKMPCRRPEIDKQWFLTTDHSYSRVCFIATNLLLLDEHHLDVAGGAHVRVDAAVSTVRATPHVGSAVHLQIENTWVKHQNDISC